MSFVYGWRLLSNKKEVGSTIILSGHRLGYRLSFSAGFCPYTLTRNRLELSMSNQIVLFIEDVHNLDSMSEHGQESQQIVSSVSVNGFHTSLLVSRAVKVDLIFCHIHR